MKLSLLTLCAQANNIDGIPLHQKAVLQLAPPWRKPQLFFSDVGNGFASGTHHVMVFFVVHLHAHGAMMHAHLAEDPTFNEQMNVFVDSSQRDSRHLLLDFGVHFFRTGMPLHALHHLVQDLALMGHRDSVFSAKVTKIRGSPLHENQSTPKRTIKVIIQ